MNPYDLVHQLARAMKDSEEYREYARLRETAYEDETNRALLDEYKRLQFRMQAKMAMVEAKGISPALARPAAMPNMFCSAMPTL